jgi:hypothetical protein
MAQEPSERVCQLAGSRMPRYFYMQAVRLKKKRNPIRNPVARYMHEFNKPVVIPDKKKREKDGYIKHKEQQLDE